MVASRSVRECDGKCGGTMWPAPCNAITALCSKPKQSQVVPLLVRTAQTQTQPKMGVPCRSSAGRSTKTSKPPGNNGVSTE